MTCEQFGQILYQAGAYLVVEVDNKLYGTKHTHGVRMKKWSRVVCEVTMINNREEFECECSADNSDTLPVSVNRLVGLSAPYKKRAAGRANHKWGETFRCLRTL